MDIGIKKAKLKKTIKFRKYCNMWRLFSQTIFSKFDANAKFMDSKNLLLTRKNEKIGHDFLSAVFQYLNVSLPGGVHKIIHLEVNKQMVRTFYSHLLIVFHTEQIIGEASKRNETTSHLVKNATNLYIHLHKLSKIKSELLHKETLVAFLKAFSVFLENFEEWKEQDKQQMIRQCIYNFWELEVVKYKDYVDPQQHLSVIKQMESQQRFTLNNLKMMDRENGMKEFNKFIPFLHKNLFKDVNESILKLSYWEQYRLELYQDNPPCFDKLISTMTRLKEEIVKVFPNRNKEHYLNEINEKYDVTFICDMVKNKVYTIDQLKALVSYFVSMLRLFDAPSQDEVNNKVHELLLSCLDRFEKNETISITEKIGEAWIIVFENIYPIFETLFVMKKRFQELLTKNKNK